MIGYFEKEALLEGIQKIINSCIPNKTPPMDALNKVVDYIMFFPTADVVPSSEVAKEFTCFVGDPHKVDHCPYLDEIEKAKSEVEKLEQAYNDRLAKDIQTNADFVKYAKREVAREIFEEIYEDCFDQFGYINYEALAKLKKKYTEER